MSSIRIKSNKARLMKTNRKLINQIIIIEFHSINANAGWVAFAVNFISNQFIIIHSELIFISGTEIGFKFEANWSNQTKNSTIEWINEIGEWISRQSKERIVAGLVTGWIKA